MSDVNIQISNDVIKGIIEKKLETSLAQALGSEQQLLGAIVHKALSVKVNDNGQVSGDYYARNDLITWLCNNAIEKAARTAVETWVNDKGSVIQAEVLKQLDKQKSAIASNLVAAFADGCKNQYRMAFQMNIIKD